MSFVCSQFVSNSSIWPIDSTLSGVTTPGQNEPGSDGIEGVFCILQSSNICGASLSDCLVSWSGHLLERGLTSLQRCNRCVLKPQPTGLMTVRISGCGEALVLELWRLWSAPLLPLPPVPLWPKVVVPIRVPSKVKIDQFLKNNSRGQWAKKKYF